jgi:hypothetical protein
MIYKLYIRPMQTEPDAAYTVNENGSMTSFIFDLANTDAQQFAKWLQEGNIPTSADGETTVTQEEVDAIITLLNG